MTVHAGGDAPDARRHPRRGPGDGPEPDAAGIEAEHDVPDPDIYEPDIPDRDAPALGTSADGSGHGTGAATGPAGRGTGGVRRAGHRRYRLADAASVVLTAVIAAMVLCVVVFGSLTAVRYPLFSPVDEAAHFAYIQQVAEHGSLPVLGRTYTSGRVLAIEQGRYHGRRRSTPGATGSRD